MVRVLTTVGNKETVSYFVNSYLTDLHLLQLQRHYSEAPLIADLWESYFSSIPQSLDLEL